MRDITMKEVTCDYYDVSESGAIERVYGPVDTSTLLEHLDYDLPITKRVLDAIR